MLDERLSPPRAWTQKKIGATMEGQQYLINRIIEYRTSIQNIVWGFSIQDYIFVSSTGEESSTST